MSALRVSAPAKVNLYLRIVGKRTDGLHEVETILQKIDVGDELTLERAARDELVVAESAWPIGPPRENLVWRALLTLRDMAEFPSARVTLTKQVPPGAGLGGGSSDAAATLRGLVELFDLHLGEAALHAAARSLGADVPFLLSPHCCAVGRGAGDELTPISHRAGWRVGLVYPGHPSATAEAYRDWRTVMPPPAPAIEGMIRALEVDDIAAASSTVHNDFASFLFKRFPAMAEARDALREAGWNIVWPTGSGSTVVGLACGGTPAMEVVRERQRPGTWINVASLLQHV